MITTRLGALIVMILATYIYREMGDSFIMLEVVLRTAAPPASGEDPEIFSLTVLDELSKRCHA